MKELKKNVTATDSGDQLSAKYITVNAKKLIAAMSTEEYGTYQVTAYAKDKAGNKSKKVTFQVDYVNPNPEVKQPTEDTELPAETTESTENVDSTNSL
jgi:hypothetical protein